MGRTWVLRTDTKGTGAQMVPLGQAEPRPSAVDPVLVRREPRQPPPSSPSTPPPRRFRIVDVMSRRTLADEVSAREAAKVLRGVRSPVDVSVFVRREQRGRWRAVGMSDRRALWELARRQPPDA